MRGTELVDRDIDAVLDRLAYASYRANRELAPQIAPERWGKVYGAGAVEEMERRLRAESPSTIAQLLDAAPDLIEEY